MNISMNTAAVIAQTANGDVGMAVLKKSIDSEARGVMALINAIPQPQPSSANLPPNSGRNINVTA